MTYRSNSSCPMRFLLCFQLGKGSAEARLVLIHDSQLILEIGYFFACKFALILDHVCLLRDQRQLCVDGLQVGTRLPDSCLGIR